MVMVMFWVVRVMEDNMDTEIATNLEIEVNTI